MKKEGWVGPPPAPACCPAWPVYETGPWQDFWQSMPAMYIPRSPRGTADPPSRSMP